MSMDRKNQSQLQALIESSSVLAQGDDLDASVGRLVGLLSATLGASMAVVYLQDPDRTELQLAVATGVSEANRELLQAALANPDSPIAATSRDRTARDLGAGTEPIGVLGATGQGSATLQPLGVTRGGIDLPLGVLLLGWPGVRRLDDGEARLLKAVTDLIAVAVDRARLASMVQERSEWFERMAHTDPLTGLANQRTFSRILELELARAARQGSEIAIAIFDIDGLGAVNSAAGHEAGDDVLRAVASVLAESVRLVDTVARYGGDEFVVIAPGSAGATVAQRVLDGVRELSAVGDASITVSAGVAQFPQDGTTSEEMLAAASKALSEAQAAGPGHLVTATPTSRS
jgi:diguanylate cyclase (GGDEF)-like protein